MAAIAAVIIPDSWIVRKQNGDEDVFDVTVTCQGGTVTIKGPGGDRSALFTRDEWEAIARTVNDEFKRSDERREKAAGEKVEAKQ